MGAKNYSNEFLCPDLHAACTSLAAMAARATRSASRKARATEAVATGPLGALSHDELGVIFDGLADPLQPVVAVALSSTCLGLRTPLGSALEVLKQRHARAKSLCIKVGMSLAELADAEVLEWTSKRLTTEHLATLGMIIMSTRGLPKLQELMIDDNAFGDEGMHALCKDLGHGALPSFVSACFANVDITKTGAQSLAAALSRGAFPALDDVYLGENAIGDQGVCVLAKALRSRPAMNTVYFGLCSMGDAGVAALVTDLGKDEFKQLEYLGLWANNITDIGCATLVSSLDAGGMPMLKAPDLKHTAASDISRAAVQAAGARNDQRRTVTNEATRGV